MTLTEQAIALVNKIPLPDDAEQQLDAIIAKAEGIERDELITLAEALLWRREIDSE